MLSKFNPLDSRMNVYSTQMMWIQTQNGLLNLIVLPNLLHVVIYKAFTAFKHIHSDLWAIEK